MTICVKADEVYERAVDCLPHPELLTNWGSRLFLRGETARAERLYRRALAMEPDFLLARWRLGYLAKSHLISDLGRLAPHA
jgi:tetratricopeptide (TPR) repeat protein